MNCRVTIWDADEQSGEPIPIPPRQRLQSKRVLVVDRLAIVYCLLQRRLKKTAGQRVHLLNAMDREMDENHENKLTRPAVLKTGAGGALGNTPFAAKSLPDATGVTPAEPSIYQLLGVKTLINAAGTLTMIGGSLMAPEAVAAWVSASKNFVNMLELQDRVGERIAKILDVEAAMVTSGAAAAMQLATAAVLTRGEPQRVLQLPNLTGMKSEVITQKSHHTCYDNQIVNCGVKLIEVETPAELEAAINDRTAMMLFYNLYESDGKMDRRQWIEVARKHNIPTLMDAAADIPPLSSPSRYTKMGYDLVAFSGGKALLGPSDTGLLVGKKEFIDAAKMNTSPRCGTIGRMMKVSKEDMVALWAAIERYSKTDHDAERREWERRLGVIEAAVKTVPTVTTEWLLPPIANHVPHVVIAWDESRVRINREKVTEDLAAGDPSIALGRVDGTGDKGLLVSVFQLKPGEEEIVAARLRDVLKQAAI